MNDELTRTRTRAALADLAEAQRTIADPATLQLDHDKAQAALPGLLREAHVVLELTVDPDPPEPEAVDLLADPANVAAALDAPDPAKYLADLALQSDAPVSGPEALRRVLRAGHRDETPPPDLVEAAERELRRRERAARRAERLALIETNPYENADGRLRSARSALEAVRVMRPVVIAAQQAKSEMKWTGKPPDREWLIQDWLAVGRVHLLTGTGGRGKSRLALQLAAALASADPEAWPVPWKGTRPNGDHPPTLPLPSPACGVPVVLASWEDERDEVHRRLAEQSVDVATLNNRLHYVDVAEWGPLWAPGEGSRHVATMAELTPAGRRLRHLCELEHARLLVIDPLAAAYGSDENVRGLVRQYMASWDAWGRAHKCAVLMIAHPPKSNTASNDDWWSGSTDWPAAARSAWALRHQPAKAAKVQAPAQPERTWLECMKASYGLPPDPVFLIADGVTWLAVQNPQDVGTATNARGGPRATGGRGKPATAANIAGATMFER